MNLFDFFISITQVTYFSLNIFTHSNIIFYKKKIIIWPHSVADIHITNRKLPRSSPFPSNVLPTQPSDFVPRSDQHIQPISFHISSNRSHLLNWYFWHGRLVEFCWYFNLAIMRFKACMKVEVLSKRDSCGEGV
jgi:hypothetical protein